MLAGTSALEFFTAPRFLFNPAYYPSIHSKHPLQPLTSFSMRQRCNSAQLRQGTQQLARAVPEYLHSNTHQQERGEF
jgi:hypothetical protein